MRKELDNLYYKSGWMFPMAVSHLLDIGFRAAQQITEKDIEELEGNGLMTKEFVQDLVRTSKEIAEICNYEPTKLVMYCSVKELFDNDLLN